jgi:hypothetical protein
MKSDPSRDELLFLHLVSMFQFAAMQQMGKLANPVTGKIERDLEQARLSIDMIEMLQAKTAGARTSDESELLDKVLFELRMNFVDERKRAESEPPAPPSENDGGGESPQ